MRNDVVNQRRVNDAGGIELLAGDGRADDGENARPDNRANAKGRERPRPQGLFQRMLRLLRVADELID
jgi:hypothetical protein